MLELEGTPNADSTAALTSVAASFGATGAEAAAGALAAHEGKLAVADAEGLLFKVLALAMQISKRAAQLT